jgi:hypothetical protein
MAPTPRVPTKQPHKEPKQDYLSALEPTFAYICQDILEIKNDSPMIPAIREAGITNVHLLNLLTKDEIDQLTYKPIDSSIF